MANEPEIVTAEKPFEVTSTDHPVVEPGVVTSELDAMHEAGKLPEPKAEPEDKPEAKKEEKPEEAKDDDIVLDGIRIPKSTFDRIARDRINKERAKRGDIERQLAALQAAHAEAQEKLKAVQPEPKVEKPKIDDFETMDDYEEALIKWDREQRDPPKQEQEQQTPYHELPPTEQDRVYMESMTEQARELFSSKVGEAMQAGADAYADFDQVVMNPELRLSPVIVDLILSECRDVAPETMLYYLGKNPEDAVRLHDAAVRDASSALRLFGRLEAKVEAWEPTPSQPNAAPSAPAEPSAPAAITKPVTRAPEPITPAPARGRAVTKDPSQMSPEEYRAWRRAGGGR